MPTALKDRSRRISQIVRRSAPDTSRPRLPDDLEAELESIDIESAVCYSNLEDLSDQFAELAAELRNEEPVPIAILHEEESIANRAIDLQEAVKARRADTDTAHFATMDMKEAK